jgi:hypothetical protein
MIAAGGHDRREQHDDGDRFQDELSHGIPIVDRGLRIAD